MRNSKFAEAYLNIIKEENEQFAMNAALEAPVAPVPTEAGTEESGEGEQIVCFKTSDKGLIDAINSGFEEVVFFVKAKDEATGEDTIQEVKFGTDAFKDVEVKPCECGEEESCPECGEAPCTCEEGGEEGKEDEEVATECGDAEAGGEDAGNPVGEESELEEEIDPSEWLEDGVCVKCGKADCDGSCKCAKCGSQNCIGDCEGDAVATECGDAVATEEDEGGDAGDAGDAGGDGGDI